MSKPSRVMRYLRIGIVALAAVVGLQRLAVGAQEQQAEEKKSRPKLFIDIVQGQDVVNKIRKGDTMQTVTVADE